MSEASWLASLDNEQRRHHKKALSPDLPHPFRPARVGHNHLPEEDQRRFHGYSCRCRGEKPCRVCGGSEFALQHLTV